MAIKCGGGGGGGGGKINIIFTKKIMYLYILFQKRNIKRK
jgi:hypothetical protein